MASSAGSTISGANGSEEAAAVGAIVPSSLTPFPAAPRAQYVRKVRARPPIVIVVSYGPSEAVRPHMVAP